MGRGWKRLEMHFLKCFDCLKGIGRNMEIKGGASGFSGGNEEQVFNNCRKADPCYKVAKSTWLNCILIFSEK